MLKTHSLPKMLKDSTSQMGTFSVLAQADVSAIREEMLNDANHLVVPIIALVEGVIHASNAEAPELALADVFGQFPGAWNGRPVTLGHPERRGMPVSVSQSPDIFEVETLGFLFNTRLDGAKLKTEAWINLDTLADQSEAIQKEVGRLQSGDMVEVSTGLFAAVARGEGTFNGKAYEGIWDSVAPDHLAILPAGVTGACSVADGCGGPRLNEVNAKELSMNKKDKKEKDIKDAEEDKKKEEEKVAANIAENLSSTPLMNKAIDYIKALNSTFNGVLAFSRNAEGPSDVDTRKGLLSALRLESADAYYDIIAVFEDSLVYAKDFDGMLLHRAYSMDAQSIYALGEKVVEVRPVTEFVPVNLREESIMTNTKIITELIANSATQFEENDREWLESMNDDQLKKLAAPAEAAVSTDSEDDAEAPAEEAITANAAKTPEDFITQAPAEMQEVLAAGLRMHRSEKKTLVSELRDNERCTFTGKELEAMDLDGLKKLSALAQTPSYRGQAGSTEITANAAEDNIIPDAPLAFEPQQA